jgi:diadenosine tetraphosphatase ApaH/serine/threonine PP2A family protein phosphatase
VGNHDLAAVGGLDIEDFNDSAKASALWTQEVLSEQNRDWLLRLPYSIDRPTFSLVHGSPYQPEKFWYVMDSWDAQLAFSATTSRLTFVGHSHFPHVFRLLPNETKATGWAIVGEQTVSLQETLDRGGRFIINVGSVGQPRDDDPRASYVEFDDEIGTVTWHRIPYDIKTTQKKIRGTTLPERSAARLALGR